MRYLLSMTEDGKEFTCSEDFESGVVPAVLEIAETVSAISFSTFRHAIKFAETVSANLFPLFPDYGHG
jgi:hypothetical protein